jgi:hypothetical protein
MNNRAATLAIALVLTAGPVGAQWRNLPKDGVPLGPDGKANMSAPTPRTASGRPTCFEFICNEDEKSTPHMGPHVK